MLLFAEFFLFCELPFFSLSVTGIVLYIISGEGNIVFLFLIDKIFFLTSGLYISAILIAYLCCSLKIFLLSVNSPLLIISFSPANLCKNKHSLLVHSIPFKKYEQYLMKGRLYILNFW